VKSGVVVCWEMWWYTICCWNYLLKPQNKMSP